MGKERKERENERKEKKEIRRKREKETCGMVEESGGKIPQLLINSMKGIRKGEGKRKKEERGRKNVGEKERKEEKGREIFLKFRWSKLDGPRIKVDPRNESYAWVPKYGSFVKLQEVGNFPTRVISSLKAI